MINDIAIIISNFILIYFIFNSKKEIKRYIIEQNAFNMKLNEDSLKELIKELKKYDKQHNISSSEILDSKKTKRKYPPRSNDYKRRQSERMKKEWAKRKKAAQKQTSNSYDALIRPGDVTIQ